jgi:hypothetical protein
LECKPEFAGEVCSECSNAHKLLPGCVACDPKYKGANCDECSDDNFTGEGCDVCVNPTTGQSGCEDGNACTEDTCDPALGSLSTPLIESTCDYGDLCTQGDACQADGSCVGQAVNCNAVTNPCFQDVCNPNNGLCDLPVTNGTLCTDDDLCNGTETCLNGACATGASLNCTDSNACTEDTCDPVLGCVSTPLPASDCDDGDLCTQADACQADGSCAGQAVDCSAVANSCLQSACNPTTGLCDLPVANGTLCTDDDLCNGTETCQNGLCASGASLNCSDGYPCNGMELCDSTQGCVPDPNGNAADGSACSDQNACTSDDACGGGQCASGAAVNCDDGHYCNGAEYCSPSSGCKSGTPVSVSDNIPCTSDSCDESNDTIVHTPNDSQCNDGNPCTADTCSTSQGCKNQALNGTDCSDNNNCTLSDACSFGNCTGQPVVCDDGDPCTADSCNMGTGSCSYSSICAAGQTCSANQQCFGPKSTLAVVGEWKYSLGGGGPAGDFFAMDSQNIYYVTMGDDIFRVSKSGGSANTIWVNDIYDTLAPVAAVNGQVYFSDWANGFQTSFLWKIPASETQDPTLAATTSGSLTDLQTDGSFFYWKRNYNNVYSSSVNSPACTSEVFYTTCTSDNVSGSIDNLQVFTLSGNYIYMTANSPARVLRVNKNGGSVTTIHQETKSSMKYGAIAVYGSTVYWASRGGSGWTNGRVNRVSSSGSGHVYVSQSDIMGSKAPYASLVADDTGVYWTSDTSSNVMYAPSNATGPGDASVIATAGGTGPHFMRVDEWGLYWRTSSGIYKLAK